MLFDFRDFEYFPDPLFLVGPGLGLRLGMGRPSKNKGRGILAQAKKVRKHGDSPRAAYCTFLLFHFSTFYFSHLEKYNP